MATAPAPSTADYPAAALSPPGGAALRLLAYPFFFASGAAGLIYEIVWTRMLLAIFGAGLYAVCTVLAAFMAGLALGSWLLGRVSDRLGRPLRTYGALEIGIALAGAAMPLLMNGVTAVDGWIYAHLGGQFGILTAARFILAFLLLLIPTTMMGATLPVLSRFMVRRQAHLGLHVGSLYAVNTFGAVAGSFLAGFVLIASFGLLHSEWIAAGLNLFVAAGSLALSLMIERRPLSPGGPPVAATAGAPAPPTDAPPPHAVQWVLWTALLSGAAALACQVLWSRSLVFSFEYLKNTTYSFSAMLTVFLAGLAVGAALIGLWIDHERQPLRLYGVLLVLIGMAVLLSVTMLYSAGGLRIADPYDPETGILNWYLAVGNIMLQTFGVLGLPTILLGMAFPAAARVVVQVGRVGGDVGRLYAYNTVGAILGALLAGFIIIPLFGLTFGLLLLGLVEIGLGLGVLHLLPACRRYAYAFGGLAAVMLVAVWIGLPAQRGLQPVTTLLDTLVFYKEGPLATVAVMENNLKERTIYVDGVGVAGTDPIMQTDQKSLAHVPMGLLATADSALTVGFGSGGASYSFLLHDRLRRVDCIEISTTVPKAAPELHAANHGFLEQEQPRYRLIFDDARSYLTHTEQRYDIIATDCTDLRYKSNANLYDLQYFEACRARLTPDGLVVVWMPLAGLSEDVFKVALRTFHRVFPAMGIFYLPNEPTHYILLIGWQDEIQLSYERFARMLAEDDVRRDLGEIYLDDPVKLLSSFIAGGPRLAEYLAGDVLNTQNNPVIEFESPKYGYFDKPLIDNLAALMEIYTSPRQFMDTRRMPPEELERLRRYEQALPLIISGHAHYRNLRIEEAAMDYMKAAAITPDDLSLKRLLRFPILSERLRYEPRNSYLYVLLGRVYMLQPDLDKREMAYDLLTQGIELLQEDLAAGEEPEFTSQRLDQARGWHAELERELQAASAPLSDQ